MKLRRPRIEQGCPFGGVNLLVHSLVPINAIIACTMYVPLGAFTTPARSGFVLSVLS